MTFCNACFLRVLAADEMLYEAVLLGWQCAMFLCNLFIWIKNVFPCSLYNL